MIKREELNKLVVKTLDKNPLRAIDLYESIERENPRIFRQEKVRGFKSFVKILGHFPEVKQVSDKGILKKYTL